MSFATFWNYFQDGNIPLFAAVEAGNLHVCRELLLQETEAQLKYTKAPLKDTALHLAARKRDNDLVKLFIETGAVVDSQNVSFLGQKIEIICLTCKNVRFIMYLFIDLLFTAKPFLLAVKRH